MSQLLPLIKDYITLCKPRVVALMTLTTVVAMLLASPAGTFPWFILVFANLGIIFSACAAATLNHLIDARIDTVMARTQDRPIPSGRIKPRQALIFAISLIVASMLILFFLINALTAILTFLTLIGYAVVYSLYLKRATPQNIVIGGLAGAMPPLLGWTAVTNHVSASALLLVLIIFIWTPPHFWALAIDRQHEYAKANIPMLPVTHGIEFTRLNILLYSLLLVIITYLLFADGMTGLIYLVGITVLNIGFLYYAINLYLDTKPKIAYRTFRYSIVYLAMLFILLLIDHYVPIWT